MIFKVNQSKINQIKLFEKLNNYHPNIKLTTGKFWQVIGYKKRVKMVSLKHLLW